MNVDVAWGAALNEGRRGATATRRPGGDLELRTKFGRQYYDQETDNSLKKKVGPLKIIRLPSERSLP